MSHIVDSDHDTDRSQDHGRRVRRGDSSQEGRGGTRRPPTTRRRRSGDRARVDVCRHKVGRVVTSKVPDCRVRAPGRGGITLSSELTLLLRSGPQSGTFDVGRAITRTVGWSVTPVHGLSRAGATSGGGVVAPFRPPAGSSRSPSALLAMVMVEKWVSCDGALRALVYRANPSAFINHSPRNMTA